MRNKTFKWSLMGASAAAIALAVFSAPTVVAAQAVTYSFDIPAQDLGVALQAFGRAARQQVVFDSKDTRGKRSSALVGTFTADAGLQRLLGGTGLTVRRGASGVLIVAGPQASAGLAQDAGDEPAALPEILVQGQRSLNADVRRTEDDAQPYVVFGADEIDRSMASNVEEFLNARLPMNTTRGTASRNAVTETTAGNRSSFNLRGLGTNQTLILVNGRRVPGTSAGGRLDLAQPDVNGIPIAAIERIEVLPTTASGIYGGGATGGVINIILKKDYRGSELRLGYDNSFDTDSARRRVDFNTGFSLEGGRSQVMFAASYADGNDLLVGDRPFAQRGRDLAFANDPSMMTRTNLILAGRRVNVANSSNGALVLRNGTSLGSPVLSVPLGYMGGDGGAGLVAGAGSRDISIPDAVTGLRQSLSTVPLTQSANLTFRREISEAVSAYLDIGASRNEGRSRQSGSSLSVILSASDAGNPFRSRVTAVVPLPAIEGRSQWVSDTRRIDGGVIVELPGGWSSNFDINWNQSTSEYNGQLQYTRSAITAAIKSGALNIFRDLELYPLDLSPYASSEVQPKFGPHESSLVDYSARVAGPLMRIPGGEVRLTTLLSARREVAGESIEAGTRFTYLPPRYQDVLSAYAEVVVPLVQSSQDIPFIRSLEIQGALRFDDYHTSTVVGLVTILASPDAERPDVDYTRTNLNSTDFTFSALYKPSDDITLRASYGTGFLPPALSQLVSRYDDSTLSVIDPKRGNLDSFYDVSTRYAGNESLRPERSRSFSAGIIYEPAGLLAGLRLSADYTSIDKQDEITYLDEQTIVNYEDFLPGRVTRASPSAGDPAGYEGVITAIDFSAANVAASSVEAFDFQADYSRDLGSYGRLDLYAVATLQTALARQIVSGAPVVDRVGYSDGPTEWRGNVGVNWDLGSVALSANTRIYDSYLVYGSTDSNDDRVFYAAIQGSDRIASQSYTDVSLRYTPESASWGGVELLVGIKDVFGSAPRTVATNAPSGGYSTYYDPRGRVYTLSLRKTF